MRFKNSVDLINKLWITLFLCLLFTSSQLKAQLDRLELDRIWAVDLDQDVTALRLADLDGDGVNEIFLGIWDGDSGYIEIFDGLNGILTKRSEKIRTPGITDVDVGDINGDGDLEVVLVADAPIYWANWHGSLVCVLGAQQLNLEWQRITGFQIFTSVEADDIDKDDTAEVFVGSYSWSYDSGGAGPKYFDDKQYEGTLYYLDGMKKELHTEDVSVGWRKFLTVDIDHDSYKEIVCGNGFAKRTDFAGGWKYYLRQVCLQVINQNGSRYHLSTLFTTNYPFFDDFDPPHVRSMAIGDCDSDDNKEIVSYVYTGRDYLYDEYWEIYYAGPPKYILTITDATSGIVENSTSSVEGVVALTLFDIDAQPPDEIVIAHSNGIIEARNATTFDTVAISDPLPLIHFFAFGDVTDDAMPEICISDGDSLFVYSSPVTAVEEEKEEVVVSEVVLDQNYPNPFNAQTTIKFYLPQSSRVELSIYNIKGQKVKTLVDGFQSIGFQGVTWDGTDKNGAEVASGVYLYRIKTDYSEETKKMVLIK